LENQKFTRLKVNGKIYNFKDFMKGTAWQYLKFKTTRTTSGRLMPTP
jgi:hypothetical protein